MQISASARKARLAVHFRFACQFREGGRLAGQRPRMPRRSMSTERWTKEQLKLAFHLYCQLPFGKLHHSNPEIIKLAGLIGRTPSAVAMKLVNFASLDPAITQSGRKGLGNASAMDRAVWEEFNADWERLALESELLRRKLDADAKPADDADEQLVPDDYSGETKRVITEQRIKQSFFRRAVLSSYGGRCCMSGLPDTRLLVASHIVPWSQDKANRLNPSNGLCLSALHDRAFDQGLITLSDDLKVLVSEQLKQQKDPYIAEVLLPVDGHGIKVPERFAPKPEFIRWHRETLFLDNRS